MPKNPDMHAGTRYVLDAPDVSTDDGILRAVAYDDVYFSVENGLAETRHVFLAGNDLPARMAAATHLTIGETGFGSGLNLLAVMQVMAKHPELHIDYISLEAHPLGDAQMRIVHDQFPELAPYAAALRAALPPHWPGHHCSILMDGRLTLHLLYGDGASLLGNCDFKADAWFLDGFTPARNPALWSDDILRDIARLTHKNGSFATFTVAGSVRNGLMAAGFEIEKRPGFGRKRDMLVGVKGIAPKACDAQNRLHNIGIIGGGIAGASIAAGLHRRGAAPVIFDSAAQLATGASGNRLAMQTPRLAVDHNPASRMSANCLGFAASLADQLGASQCQGVLSLDWPEREAVRHYKFRNQSWPDTLIRPVTADDAGAIANTPMPTDAMLYDHGRVIDPAKFVTALAGDTPFTGGFEIVRIDRQDDGQILVTAKDGRTTLLDAVVLANGASLGVLLAAGDISGITLDITSGQVSHIASNDASAALSTGLSFGGYLTPAIGGIHELGATFERSGAMDLTNEGHQHNITLLPEALRPLVSGAAVIGGRVSQRASMPDRNPIMGNVQDNIFVLGGLGARGFTVAPLLGDMLAADMLGHANAMERDIRRLLEPFRFRDRASRL